MEGSDESVRAATPMTIAELRKQLGRGLVIPAHPLALDAGGRFDERGQRALTRYYAAAGSGGVAVGVHTTQFAIRDPAIGLFEPVLALAREEIDRADRRRETPLVRIGGICGTTAQAIAEADLLMTHRYHAGLLSLGALRDASDADLIEHCSRVADRLPLIGFYLQPSVGGRPLAYSFWRQFADIPNVVAIKVAPFNRYQTLDVVRALADSGREDVALYTGNDDNIVGDLLAPFRFATRTGTGDRRFVGGLLGHWAVWTRGAVSLLNECHAAVASGFAPATLLRTASEVTDANAAFFDAANNFSGCIAGINEILRRQGLLTSARCLDPRDTLSPHQADAIDRVCRAYPHLSDDEFVGAHLEEWLRD
jgi:dihydrodipicolinate synthase/N-acetylneuraminate lyase